MVIQCTIIHDIPGRVRFRIGNKAILRRFGSELKSFIVTRAGTTSVRLNANCASVVVFYEASSLEPQSLSGELADFLAERIASSSTTVNSVTATTEIAPKERVLPFVWRLKDVVAGMPQLLRDTLESNGGTTARSRPDVDDQRAAMSSTMPWHKLPQDDIVRKLGTNDRTGLTLESAGNRLVSCGTNTLGTIDEHSGWSTFTHQFASWPVALLLGSAAISTTTGGLADAAVILSVVAINACIGYVTERQAERTIASLQDESELTATVIRDGQRQQIEAELVVPGDLTVLTPGTAVAADTRLIEVERLMIDESTLTGESMPVAKSPDELGGERIALRNRTNMAYRGTVVTGGSARGVVVATGLATEVGRIQSLVGAAHAPQTPVQRQLSALGTNLCVATGIICGGVFCIGLLRRYDQVELLKSATSLAVAAVPEGLPMVATTTLALGVNRMRRLNVAVRRLDAVETLGSVEVFCLDKTGTLTQNQMRVVRLYAGNHAFEVNGDGVFRNGRMVGGAELEELRRLLEVAALCNETAVNHNNGTRLLEGSPTEAALIHLALDSGIDILKLRQAWPVVQTAYRTERRGYMATVHDTESESRLLAVKGRPSDVLRMCRWHLSNGARVELTAEHRAAIRTENEIMASRALRVLGFAYREGATLRRTTDDELTWLGLAGIADPIRPGIGRLMETFHRAGIRTTMITGDQSATAQAIARELRLSGTPELDTIDSAELEQLDPDILRSLAQSVHVFSSVTPSHKLEIVQALQRAGQVVAMTGDGINDGPALKAADIGVAMGGDGSTEVARMTADVVLEDNNLESMVAAISQGRAIYSNIRNAIRYLLSTNLSEIMVMTAAVGTGAGTPLNPMQLLWLNLVSDIFPVLALAVQPADDDVLLRPPRDVSQAFFDADDLKQMLLQSSVLSAGTFGSYGWGRLRYGSNAHASTMAFTSITTAQLLHMLSSRSERHSIFSSEQPPTNRFLMYALAGGLGLLCIPLSVGPLRRLLRNAPLTRGDAMISILGGGLPFLVNEAIKEWQLQNHPKDAAADEPTATEKEYDHEIRVPVHI